VDLNHDAADVRALPDPHRHDRGFMGSPAHRESMDTCLPRVRAWVAEFLPRLQRAARTPDAGAAPQRMAPGSA
jgi:hypothetical protein